MKIETKYDIGQEAWFMWDNKATQRKVESIYVYINEGEQHEKYDIVGLKGDDNVLYDCEFELEDLFPTKEELLKSLSL